MLFAFRSFPRTLLGSLLGLTLAATASATTNTLSTMDFRYQPPIWQTAICLPDDWQKTLVHKDGSLLYDYPGNYAEFATRITPGVAGGATWVRQELVAPKVPIVRTLRASGPLEITEEAFAVPPTTPPVSPSDPAPLVIQRLGQLYGQLGWAKPPEGSDPAFQNMALGCAQSVRYSFQPPKPGRYTVVFGFCEGQHTAAGQRILDLQVEGQTRRTIDPVAAGGKNKPVLAAVEASDATRDGWIDLVVEPAAKSSDKSAFLSVLWIFPGTNIPPLTELMTGRSSTPPLLHLDCGAGIASYSHPPRHDILMMRIRNTGFYETRATPTLTLDSQFPLVPQSDRLGVAIGDSTLLVCPQPFERHEKTATGLRLFFPEITLPPQSERGLEVCVARGRNAPRLLETAAQARMLRESAAKWWLKAPLPYDRITVPDPGVQALLDSSVRNIYQAREPKKGLPSFQVGAANYRGLWVVDGSFILEAVTFLGRIDEARDGMKYLLSFQRPDGSFMFMDGHWKETGIVLWALCRHAQLTGDKAWLRSVWPSLERGFAAIRQMRSMMPTNAPNAGLIPDGLSDGGLADQVPEYTNVYWTMAGLRAAFEAARWLGENTQADAWQREYDDFCATFRRAAARDTRTDPAGHRYVPIRMTSNEKILPQKAQWAFLHAVFPGKVFPSNDPVVLGNMAMLEAVECQGLIRDTGWLDKGLWNYFGSFYGHAWLWLGNGGKAARSLYAFGNHASPLLVWREEHMPAGEGIAHVGDMPHNWASAEFLRLTRHCLALERGRELHLCEGMPVEWTRPGGLTRLHEMPTEFGPLTLEFKVSPDGATGTLKLTPPRRSPPQRILLHQDRWSSQGGTIELPADKATTRVIPLRPLS